MNFLLSLMVKHYQKRTTKRSVTIANKQSRNLILLCKKLVLNLLKIQSQDLKNLKRSNTSLMETMKNLSNQHSSQQDIILWLIYKLHVSHKINLIKNVAGLQRSYHPKMKHKVKTLNLKMSLLLSRSRHKSLR